MEALTEGGDAAQKVSHPSDTLCGATPVRHLPSSRAANQGKEASFWKPEGLAAMAKPSLPGARRGSEASVPP